MIGDRPTDPLVHGLPGDPEGERDGEHGHSRPDARDGLESPRRRQSCILVAVHRASGCRELSVSTTPASHCYAL